jgi:hypothetical protein
MPFNITQFNSAIAKSGVASTSHFEAMIIGVTTSDGVSK